MHTLKQTTEDEYVTPYTINNLNTANNLRKSHRFGILCPVHS